MPPSQEDGVEDLRDTENEEAEDEELSVDSWLEDKMQKPTAARRKQRIDSEDDSEDDLFAARPNIVTPHKRRVIDSDDES